MLASVVELPAPPVSFALAAAVDDPFLRAELLRLSDEFGCPLAAAVSAAYLREADIFLIYMTNLAL